MTSLRGHKRQEFPQSVRKAAFVRCCKPDGVPKCETCGIQLSARTCIIYEHVQPDGLGGTNDLDNCKVHCRNCADIKTFREDNPRMAKADRVLKKEYGLRPSKRSRLKSRGFSPAAPQRSATRPIERTER